MRFVVKDDLAKVSKPSNQSYIRHFVDEKQYVKTRIGSFGVPVATCAESLQDIREIAELREQLKQMGARFRNDGKSISLGFLSPACVRCKTGIKSVSEFISLACKRNCYFCFNPNQCDYDLYRSQKKDWSRELSEYQSSMGGLDYIALTGGEPMLFHDDALAFFRTARSMNPQSHLRLYTSGDGVNSTVLNELKEAGLDEIRFSVKLEDTPEKIQQTKALLETAVSVIPTVMVEMPVIPGTGDEMMKLLKYLDEIGVAGINLLEFCFPLHNAHAFQSRGFKLVADPYRIPYDYGYAGALPVIGSEALSLKLMRDGYASGLSFGMHYCSLENKNTAQIYEQNEGGILNIPFYTFSNRTHFYETVRVFEGEAKSLIKEFDVHEIPYAYDDNQEVLMYEVRYIPQVFKYRKDITQFLASAVIEMRDKRRQFREVGLQVIEADDEEYYVQLEDEELFEEGDTYAY